METSIAVIYSELSPEAKNILNPYFKMFYEALNGKKVEFLELIRLKGAPTNEEIMEKMTNV